MLGSWSHWTLTETLSLDHAERRRWVDEFTTLTGDSGRPPW
ncbi:hypothetical protein [Nocardia aurea]|uniref:Uncharacterized protein n=1 Tax=Nocardia aurea TaxID=2144174 RepID=A0ABV3G1L7_9NOCA